MKQVQEVFLKLGQTKKDLKNQKGIYKDALEGSENYKMIVEQIKVLREKKKQHETITKRALGAEYQKIEDLALEVKTQQEMLNDVAITTLMKDRTVEAEDEYGNKYGPEWKVKFKKGYQSTLF